MLVHLALALQMQADPSLQPRLEGVPVAVQRDHRRRRLRRAQLPRSTGAPPGWGASTGADRTAPTFACATTTATGTAATARPAGAATVGRPPDPSLQPSLDVPDWFPSGRADARRRRKPDRATRRSPGMARPRSRARGVLLDSLARLGRRSSPATRGSPASACAFSSTKARPASRRRGRPRVHGRARRGARSSPATRSTRPASTRAPTRRSTPPAAAMTPDSDASGRAWSSCSTTTGAPRTTT